MLHSVSDSQCWRNPHPAGAEQQATAAKNQKDIAAGQKPGLVPGPHVSSDIHESPRLVLQP
ncbi:hypothetical protein GCM10009760_64930 [Kitasatospora kazusensis]|uniref:Uncharacterized protein n=1 Tax=Kitasatospora kazusensis TaxID=407974 RepID=A0ABP4KHB2_9ACTN